jgi:hypothetical protein
MTTRRRANVPIGLRLTTVLLAALVTASAAGAAPGFKGNVCGIVSAKQVTAIAGVSSKCTNAKPSQGPGSTIYVGNWAGLTPTSPTVQVTIAAYTDAGALQLAQSNLKQGLPGPPKKVAGLGGPAYEAKGALSAGIHVTVGKYIAYITLSVRTPPKSATVLEPLAKAVAARL